VTQRDGGPSVLILTKDADGTVEATELSDIADEGLCVGRDSGEAVTADYPNGSPHRFIGGTIRRVAVDVSGAPYVDLEREAVGMLARE
jgi:hypothetical protein